MSKNQEAAERAYKETSNPNIIINGDMRVAQRGTSFPAITSTYHLDRWTYGANSDAVVTISQGTNTPGGSPQNLCPFTKYLELDVTTADGSLSAAQYSHILYNVEGNDAEILAMGSSLAKEFTISFWHAHTKTGTQSIAVRNNGGSRSYVAEYTQSVADTWEYTEITIPGDTSGAWTTGTTLGLSLIFTPGTSSTYAGTPGLWLSGNYIGSTGQVNNLDSTSNFFRITGVKLEVGGYATPWAHRPFAEELALCRRYFQTSDAYGTVPSNGGQNTVQNATVAYTTVAGRCLIVLPVEMRTNPTMTYYHPLNGYSGSPGQDGHWQYYNSGYNDTTSAVSTATGNTKVISVQMPGSYTVNDSMLTIGSWSASAEL